MNEYTSLSKLAAEINRLSRIGELKAGMSLITEETKADGSKKLVYRQPVSFHRLPK